MAKASRAEQLLDLKLAKKRLEEYKSAGAIQPGMFSVLEEVIKQAPFEKAPGSEWIKYVKPGRVVTRGGVSFPLKQSEFDIMGMEDVPDEPYSLAWQLSSKDMYTKDEVLDFVRSERPHFAVRVGKQEFNPITGGFYTPPEPEVLPKQWLQAGAAGTITPKGTYADLGRIEVRPTSHGQVDVAGGSKQSHRSPGSTYEESITAMPGVVHYPQGHYAPDVVVWSRSSTHPQPNYRVRLVEEIQSDVHRKANEKLYIDDQTHKIYLRDEIPADYLDDAGEPIIGAGDLRVEKRGYSTGMSEMDVEDWQDELTPLVKKLEQHKRREFLRGTDLEHVVQDRIYTPQQLLEAQVRRDELRHLIAREEMKVTDAPFKSPQEYGAVELRKQLMNAVDNDDDYLALIQSKDLIERTGPGFPVGKRQRGFELKYDKVYLRELEKLARRYKAEIEEVEIQVGIGDDVRPQIMGMDDFNTIDELTEWINIGIEESIDKETAMLNAMQYSEFASQMQEMITKQEHLPKNMANSLIRKIKADADKLAERINQRWDHASSGDPEGIYKWEEFVSTLQGTIHRDMDKLWERYLQHMGTAGKRTKKFPAIKLTPEVKELIREIGVPLAKVEDQQPGEPDVVMAALGGLVRKYKLGGEVITDEKRREIEERRAVRAEKEAQENAELAARWEEGDVAEDSGLIKYLKSITRSLAGAVPGIAPETRQWLSDTMRYLPSGLASQWQSLDPETGEASFVVPIAPLPPEVLHYGGMSPEEYEEANKVIAAHNAKFRPNIIDETKMIPGLPGMFFPETFGEPPQFAVEAMERSADVARQIEEELEIPPPSGFIQGATQGMGIMLGQVPVPGAALRGMAGDVAARVAGPTATALALTAPKSLTTAAKAVTLPPRAAMEFFNPFVDPKMASYMMGAGFGGTLLAGAEMLGGESELEPSPETFEQEQQIRRNKARVTDEWAGLETFENRMDVIADPQVGNVVWYWLSQEDKDAFVEEVYNRGLMTEDEYEAYQAEEPEGYARGGYIKKLIKLRNGIIDAEELFERQRRIARGEDVEDIEPDPSREQIIQREPEEGEEIIQLTEKGTRIYKDDLEEIVRLHQEGKLELDDPWEGETDVFDPENIRTVETEHLPPTPEFLEWLEDFQQRLAARETQKNALIEQMNFKYEPGDIVQGTLYRHEILFKDVDKEGRPMYRVKNLDEGGEYDLREEGIRGRFGDIEEYIPDEDIVSYLEELEAQASLEFEQFAGPNRGVTLFEEPIGEGIWEGFVELDDGTYKIEYDVNEADPRNRFEMIEDED